MDKILKVLKNKWFRLGVSFISFIYVIILGKIVSVTFTSYLEIDNFSTFLIFYVFVNFLFGVVMFFTRKQIPTMLTAIIIPLESFVLMIVGFGQWYIVIPPVAVSAIIFLASKLAESYKTVMGTLLLIMFVVGGLGYSVMSSVFGITVSYVANEIASRQEDEDESRNIDLNYAARSYDYLMSESGDYRLVKYVEVVNSRTTTIYCVEEAYKDTSYPFVECLRVYGCRKVLTTVDRTVSPRWVTSNNIDTLYIDGLVINMEEFFTPKIKEPEAEETAETTRRPIFPHNTTTAAEETAEPEETEETTDEA